VEETFPVGVSQNYSLSSINCAPMTFVTTEMFNASLHLDIKCHIRVTF